MNFLLGSSPVMSQVLNVNRHSLACGACRLNAPFVTSSMNPRSWSSAKARIYQIEISWLTSFRPLISKQFQSAQFCCQQSASVVQFGFVAVETLDVAVVGFPAHPFRFRRQIPFVRIEVGN
jgi:hypothetical protein